MRNCNVPLHFKKERQVALILVIFTMQDEYKNVNILLNFCIPPNHAAHTADYTCEAQKKKKIHKRILLKGNAQMCIDSFGFGQTCRNRSNVSARIDVQINKSMYVRFASIISRTINHGFAVPLRIFSSS